MQTQRTAKRDKLVTVRFNEAEYAALVAKADEENLSVADIIRRALDSIIRPESAPSQAQPK